LLNESSLSGPKSQYLQRLALILREYTKNLEVVNLEDGRLEKVKGLTSAIAMHVARQSPLNEEPFNGGYYGAPRGTKLTDPSLTVILWLIGFVIATRTTPSLQILLTRLVQHNISRERYPQYLEDTLVPVLTALIEKLKELQIAWPSEPVSEFAVQIIKQLGIFCTDTTIIPPEGLAQFGCGCEQCINIRTFFSNSETNIRINAPTIQSHLISHLQHSDARFLGFKWTVGASQILQVSNFNITRLLLN
jgi:hypothetical protein